MHQKRNDLIALLALGIGVLTVVIAAFVAVGGVPIVNETVCTAAGNQRPAGFWCWLHGWQTLFGAVLALAAAFWTVRQMRKQTTLLTRQSRIVAFTFADEAMQRADRDRNLLEPMTRLAHSAQNLAMLASSNPPAKPEVVMEIYENTMDLLTKVRETRNSTPAPTGWHLATIQSRDEVDFAFRTLASYLDFFASLVVKELTKSQPSEGDLAFRSRIAADILRSTQDLTQRISDHHKALGGLTSELAAFQNNA
ncbi:hypothetical protein [Roseibium sp.]|uniref:hypothetical protein n=1 Tax=Roseibium sp. TaxID=1936156 RepID=UPI001AFD5E0C|nr:hypothetical protein [Roseibium sp.]MBO6856772.1 hypothetical protein [Roseibium sp.]